MLVRTLYQIGQKLRTNIEDRRYHALYSKYKEYTMVASATYVENLKLSLFVSELSGAIVECGVWKGGMIAGLAELNPDKEVYLLDSFEGLPEVQEIDGDSAARWQKEISPTEKGHFNCSVEPRFARNAMELSGHANFHIIQGWFEETTLELKFSEGISILRLDGDWYDSIFVCLKNLYPYINKGGLVLIDDYYLWDGCARAVHDYLSQNKLAHRIHQIDSNNAYIKVQ